MRGITYDVLRMTYEKIAAGSLVRSILAAGCWRKVGARGLIEPLREAIREPIRGALRGALREAIRGAIQNACLPAGHGFCQRRNQRL